MGYETRISTDGQVVLPQAVRDALDWREGQTLDIVASSDGVTLRAAREPQTGGTTEEILARIRARAAPWVGPPLSEEDIQQAIGDTIEEKWEPRFR